jgi:hypothetical protein
MNADRLGERKALNHVTMVCERTHDNSGTGFVLLADDSTSDVSLVPGQQEPQLPVLLNHKILGNMLVEAPHNFTCTYK